MILRPEQIKLLRQGMPCNPANGGGGSSESSSDQTSTTINTDRRIATDSGLVATDGGRISYNSETNIQSVDKDIVNKALDTVQVGTATNGDGFSKLLDLANNFVTKTQDTASSMTARYQADVLDAYSRSSADKQGGIDQKTMIVMGVTAAAALVMINKKRGN